MKGSDLFIVKEGDVEIFRDGFRVRTLAKGEMTGEHAAFYDDKPYNVTALGKSEECKLGILKGKHMHALFKTKPALEDSFREIVVRRDLKKAICAATRQPFPETEQQLLSIFELVAHGEGNFNMFDRESVIISTVILKFLRNIIGSTGEEIALSMM